MENTKVDTKDKRTEWFDDFVASLRVDELALVSGTASADKEEFYNIMMSKDIEKMMNSFRGAIEKQYLVKLVATYVEHLKSMKKPQALAAKLFNNKVLIWAQIEDNDEDLERNLLKAESKINSEFYDYGYRVSSTIVEEGDNIPVPAHYKSMLAAYA